MNSRITGFTGLGNSNIVSLTLRAGKTKGLELGVYEYRSSAPENTDLNTVDKFIRCVSIMDDNQ